MTLLKWPHPKDPGDVLDYSLDVAGALDPSPTSPTGDVIATVTWTLPSGITKVTQLESGTLAVIWLSGGSAGRSYVLNANVVSQQGRTVNRDIELEVAER